MTKALFRTISQHSALGMQVLNRVEGFWNRHKDPLTQDELLRYSFFMGIFAFAGYLFSYTVTGKVWSTWPFIHSTLPVIRALMCAGLQWLFFSIFPLLSSLILQSLFGQWKSGRDLNPWTVVCTYSMTPVFLGALFVGAPYFGRIVTVLSISTFLYLLFFGYRVYLQQDYVRSFILTFTVASLFALIRQVFVFVIGF